MLRNFAPGKRPPARLYSLKPCNFRLRRDGNYFDYALVQGDADPFTGAAVGPRYEKIGHSGRFTLYEKRGAETESTLSEPDKVTCERE